MSLIADLLVTPGESGAKSQKLERAFFDCLRLRNGVYKTTYPHRMDDLNAWVANYLPAARPLQVLDVAISSGVSTLEWVESLEHAGLAYHMTGIDLTIGGLLVSFGDRLHAVVDETKWPMLFEIKERWLSNPPGKRQLIRNFLSLALIRAALSLWETKYQESEQGQIQRILGMPTKTQAINLVTAKLANHHRVTISEGNILADSWQQGTFHVIRAANILYRGYFDDGNLTKILNNLRRHLVPNGILVVCRTDDDEKRANRATIFRLCEDGRFEALAKMNGGSEIEDLVLGLSKPESDGAVLTFSVPAN